LFAAGGLRNFIADMKLRPSSDIEVSLKGLAKFSKLSELGSILNHIARKEKYFMESDQYHEVFYCAIILFVPSILFYMFG
jgi:hypothetical protein